jgi:hypothetical protein
MIQKKEALDMQHGQLSEIFRLITAVVSMVLQAATTV